MNRRTFKDYAILYRGNFQAKALETQLRELQVPYKLSGGTSFYARAEIKDVMCYLRLIINPDDDSAFLRIINTPKRCHWPCYFRKARRLCSKSWRIIINGLYRVRFSSHLGQKKALVSLHEFATLARRTCQEILENTDPVPRIRQLLSDIAYEDYIRETAPTPQGAEARLENINFLLNSVQNMLNKAEMKMTKTSKRLFVN
jgi:ATP-dependent DNA helicase Rep